MKQVIGSLRERFENFPNARKDDAIDIVDDLQLDIQQTPLNKDRTGRRLRRLVAIASCSEDVQNGTDELVDSLSDFTKNIIVIAGITGISTERVFPVCTTGTATD